MTAPAHIRRVASWFFVGLALALVVGVGIKRIESLESQLLAIQSLLNDGRYDEAEGRAKELRSNAASALSPGLDLRLTTILVEALVLNGRAMDPSTLALANHVLATRESAGGVDPTSATGLRLMGQVLHAQGDYRQAESYFRRAQAERERYFGADAIELAGDLRHLAQTLMWLERFDEAAAAAERALAIEERARPPSMVSIARTLETRALVLQRSGQYPRARIDLDRALVIREANTPHHPETATLLTMFGEQMWLEGDARKAFDLIERAVRIAEATLRPGHPELAATLRSFAIPVQDLGDLTRARALRERALDIAEAALGPDHPLVAMQLNDLAISFNLLGEHARARPLYERAMKIYERHLGPEHTGVTTGIHNLAIMNVLLADVREAERLQARALKTWEHVVGPDHPFVARALQEFGSALAQSERHREAISSFERALAIRKRTLGVSHPATAESLASLANSLLQIGQLARARTYSQEALQALDASGGGDIESRAAALLIDGRISTQFGLYSEAHTSFGRALEIVRPVFGRGHPRVTEAQVALAYADAQLGRRAEALRGALDAENAGRSQTRLTLGSLSERQALDYVASQPKAASLVLSMVTNPEEALDAYRLLVASRALVLDEVASRHRGVALRADSSERSLWTSLTSARQRLANLAVRGLGGWTPEQYATLLDEARRTKEEAERALAERSRAFRSALERADIDLEAIRGALPTRSALVSYVRYERTALGKNSRSNPQPSLPPRALGRTNTSTPSYGAFVLRADGSPPTMIHLASAQVIESLAARWRREVVPGAIRGSSSSRAERELRQVGAELRALIWDPLRPDLADVERVFVVPDGIINHLSLAALPVGRTEYMLESGPTIHYLAAERDLVPGPTPTTVGHGLLALGDAAFSEPKAFYREDRRQRTTASAPPEGTIVSIGSAVAAGMFRGSSSACASFQAMRFGPLVATNREVLDVVGLWQSLSQDSSSGALVGSQASESAFKTRSSGRRVLHVATHGFFLGDECPAAVSDTFVGGTRSVGGLAPVAEAGNRPSREPPGDHRPPENPLLLSGLALAGANRRTDAGPDEDDGILTAEEVASLNLEGVEWAVLSACDTGLGRLQAGEGVLGLRRAFQIAGVRTVIMSLWSVEDQSTRQWMQALYEGRLLRKLDTADAMREASLNVLRARRAQGLSTHPFYWAAFVAAGDWR